LEGGLEGDDDAVPFAIEEGGELIGWIQYYEERDRHYTGRGLGSESLRVLARHLFKERGHHRLVIDPSADNTRAIRTYEDIGFRRVGGHAPVRARRRRKLARRPPDGHAGRRVT
jgi:aminoglycoside 6'-N-acetyltransferase